MVRDSNTAGSVSAAHTPGPWPCGGGSLQDVIEAARREVERWPAWMRAAAYTAAAVPVDNRVRS